MESDTSDPLTNLKRNFNEASDEYEDDDARDKTPKRRKLKVVKPTTIEQENEKQIKINGPDELA